MCELLCPAGSPEALRAAIDGGADAVYMGGLGFNARRNARNFSEAELSEAVALAHTYGVKVYVTQNTLIFDRELSDYLRAAESALTAGADALIVADLGGAAAIRRQFPKAELHASTQMSGHNAAAAARLADMGFSRMVCAREASLADLTALIKASPIETEVFVHGALCVCHSGQCLFSSVVGGRSGNRGECAQPCRLPYTGGYPLSLKDLALAEHIPTLKALGVASLKIEGRMKSPEYVREVAAVYRRLLDENRAATKEEMKHLAAIFSRGGFTDGYFTGKLGHGMLGTRSEADKDASRALAPFREITRKRPVAMTATLKEGEALAITLSCEDGEGRATGPIPQKAQTAPLTKDSLTKSLSKLGNTPFSLSSLRLDMDEGLMLPISALNAARREAVAALCQALTERKPIPRTEAPPLLPKGTRKSQKSARFLSPKQIPSEARDYFDIVYLPLEAYDGSTNGVALPPVIFDSERAEALAMLKKAATLGATHALVGNLGHLDLAIAAGLVPHGDLRLNVTNNASIAVCESLGFADVILSPELSLPRARDIGGATLLPVYGRLPLMLLEKCVGKELSDCKTCAEGRTELRDRRGISFPVLRTWKHRSVIYNSLPTSLSDKQDELKHAGITGEHFLFSTETKEECAAVIRAFREGNPLPFEIRRLPK